MRMFFLLASAVFSYAVYTSVMDGSEKGVMLGGLGLLISVIAMTRSLFRSHKITTNNSMPDIVCPKQSVSVIDNKEECVTSGSK